MNLITCASYYGSGSSAVTDLLSEYICVKSLGSNFECRIAHDMFGISDLEYYLVDNYHRHNSSTAIAKFKRLMGLYGLNKTIRLENYPLIFGDSFYKAVEHYISKLVISEFEGGSHIDLYELSDANIFKLKCFNRIYHKFFHYNYTNEDSTYAGHVLAPLEKARKTCTSYISYPRAIFLNATKEFTKELFDSIKCDCNYLLVDQLVPPTNTARYIRYFENLKVICVDRDPRDIYYLEKKYWRGGVVPDDPDAFVRWYSATRAHKEYEHDDPQTVLRIQFEDLVFDYDSMVRKIEGFIGLCDEDHVQPLSYFDPKISMNNIGLWKNDKDELKNIQYIEKSLLY